MKHCCRIMEHWAVVEPGVLEYFPTTREYKFVLYDDPDYHTHKQIFYCPWCGMKLPESLAKEWENILKQDLGLHYISQDAFRKLPEKYKTEQWWREKGL